MIALGQIASCQYGLSRKADPEGERLYIGMGQLQGGSVIPAGANRLTVSPADAAKYGLRIGDVLFNRTNSLHLVGKTAVVRGTELEGAVFASYLVRLQVDAERYDTRFLNLWMNCRDSVERLKRLATPAVAQFNIRPSLLVEKFLVPDWPLREQQKVANIEEMFDRARVVADKLIESKRAFMRGLMRQLLTGHRRFPEFVRSPDRQPGQFGTLPRDWSVLHISEIASESRARGETDGAVVYSCTKHEGLVPSLEYFGKQVFSRNLDGYKRLQTGDFAYATNHIEEGSIGLLREGMAPGLVSPMYTVFRPADRVNPEYLFAALKTESYRRVFETRMSASVDRRGSLRWDQFSRIRVPVPPQAEQDRIVATLKLMERELDLLTAQREQVESYKRSLLARLLSGELRVSGS